MVICPCGLSFLAYNGTRSVPLQRRRSTLRFGRCQEGATGAWQRFSVRNGAFHSVGASDQSPFDSIATSTLASALQAALGNGQVNTVLGDTAYNDLSATKIDAVAEGSIQDVHHGTGYKKFISDYCNNSDYSENQK